MTISRREFLKDSAVASALAAAAGAGTAQSANIITESQFTQMKWSKAPCRFCGTGCGVKVAVKDGKVVATHADANAEVNRGINCVKGYFLSKIMYGEDRLTRPLLRMRDGKFHKDIPLVNTRCRLWIRGFCDSERAIKKGRVCGLFRNC